MLVDNDKTDQQEEIVSQQQKEQGLNDAMANVQAQGMQQGTAQQPPMQPPMAPQAQPQAQPPVNFENDPVLAELINSIGG